MLNRLAGPDDLIALMTPDMAANDITFTRRTDKIADLIERAGFWGQRNELIKKDPIDQMYEQCYPPEAGSGRSTSVVAEEMIQRRREKATLDALEELVFYLGGLREERKGILLVSEGWLLYRPNRALADSGTPRRPGVYVGPDGRITTSDPRNYAGVDTSRCDQDRLALAGLDNSRRYLDILRVANRSNASFYPIEPRGLVVFDTDIGPNPPPPINVDFAMLRQRHETLKTAALDTDGIAVMDSNDIDAGLQRVVSDLSSYYLLGYSSTNAKADGRYRTIRVRVKRPGSRRARAQGLPGADGGGGGEAGRADGGAAGGRPGGGGGGQGRGVARGHPGERRVPAHRERRVVDAGGRAGEGPAARRRTGAVDPG